MTDKTSAPGQMTLSEMREFASFPAATQRYIRRALDISLEREDAVERWSRDVVEVASIKAQYRFYERLPDLRAMIPDSADMAALESFMAPLITISAFDLGQGRIEAFGAFRFLYERLLGAHSRPWLPAAFCAAAAMPHLQPERRRALLQSMSDAAATAEGWSEREPSFYPEWIEKIDEAKSAQ